MIKKTNILKHLRRPTVQVFLSIVLFGISAHLVSDGKLAVWERIVFNAVYNLPEVIYPLVLAFTQLGGIIILFIIAGIALVKRQYQMTIKLLMSGLLAYLLTGVAKDLLGRPRPLEFLTDILYRDLVVRGPGFPSGHVALATAVALTLGQYLPSKYRWLVPVWIVGVCFSRVYLGVHAPLDIVGGLAIGWGSAEIFRTVEMRDIRTQKRK